MKRRRWDSKTKTKIVLEGLSGRPVSEICNDYGIHQNQYYTWRDSFLTEAHSVFESKKNGGEVERLRRAKESLVMNWTSGLIITTGVTCIQHMDTEHQFR
ncbi:MAG: transposase [Thermodesulfobacteriota bacterium]